MYEVVYAYEVVQHDLSKIQEPWKTEIKEAIGSKLTDRPVVYTRPLRRSLKGYRKLRIGDYRIVLRIEGNIVKIFVIQHRSTVYVTAPKRIND